MNGPAVSFKRLITDCDGDRALAIDKGLLLLFVLYVSFPYIKSHICNSDYIKLKSVLSSRKLNARCYVCLLGTYHLSNAYRSNLLLLLELKALEIYLTRKKEIQSN